MLSAMPTKQDAKAVGNIAGNTRTYLQNAVIYQIIMDFIRVTRSLPIYPTAPRELATTLSTKERSQEPQTIDLKGFK